MTNKQIHNKYKAAVNKVSYWTKKILELQEMCEHPNALKEYKGDTGNWDRGSDRYWIDYKCPDCGKFWREDQ